MFFIETERLKLIPLTHEQLVLWRQDRAAMESGIGLNISTMQIDPLYQAELTDALENFWIPKTLANPDRFKWYTNWEIVLKSINTSIGGIGFGEPNDQGEAETGFMIDMNHHRKGYALEALRAMLRWGFAHNEIRAAIAQTTPDNNASQQLLIRAGFSQTETKNDLLQFRINNTVPVTT